MSPSNSQNCTQGDRVRMELKAIESQGDSKGVPLAGMRALKLPSGAAGTADSDDDEPEDMQACKYSPAR